MTLFFSSRYRITVVLSGVFHYRYDILADS